MYEQYDVVIIGAGLGGISCAALTSHAGLKTLVLERSNRLGGRCGSYQKNGCTIDFFCHMFGACEKGPIGEILRTTDSEDAISFWHVDPENKPVLMIDGKTFAYPDLSCATGEDLKAMYRGFGMPEADFQAALTIDEKIYSMDFAKSHELDDISFGDWLAQYSSNEMLMSLYSHRSSLMGFMTRYEASAGEMIRTSQTWHLNGNLGYPYGGSQAIADGFATITRNYQGTIRTGASVESILIKNGSVCGVRLQSGEEISSKAVIANCGVKETVLSMVDKRMLSQEYLDYINSLSCGVMSSSRLTSKILNIKVLLDNPVILPPVVFGIPSSPSDTVFTKGTKTPQKKSLNELSREEVLTRFKIYMPVVSNMDPSLAPEGKQLLVFNGLATGDDLKISVNNRIEELDTVFPGLKKELLWWDVVPGPAIQGSSGRFQSDVIGLVQSVGQVGKSRPSIESPIDGLFFVGADVGKNYIGTELAVESALRTAEKVKNHLM